MASGTLHITATVDSIPQEQMKRLPQVKGGLTKFAGEICGRANALGAGYRTKKYRRDDGTEVGDTQPKYAYERAKNANAYGAVATVHPKNYAAMKDAIENNTLLKAGG